jgi:hypothetical protein
MSMTMATKNKHVKAAMDWNADAEAVIIDHNAANAAIKSEARNSKQIQNGQTAMLQTPAPADAKACGGF